MTRVKEVLLFLKKYGKLYFFYALILSSLLISIWIIFISGYLQEFVDWLNWFIQYKRQYIYVVAFLVSVVEGTIILALIPGSAYIVLMGAMLAQGDLNPFILYPIIISGAMMGDLLGYSIGSYVSHNIKSYDIKKNKHYLVGHEFIEKHGGKSVFFARFISVMKEVIPAVAGVLGMDLKKFMFYNFLGAIGWSLAWTGIGFFAGNYIKELSSLIKIIGLVLLFSFSSAALIFYRKNKKKLEEEQRNLETEE